MSNELIIGLMSGTSVDGIDAALVEFESFNSLSVLETEFTPFDSELRASINHLALNNLSLRKESDSELHTQLANHYAKACLSIIKKAGVSASAISAIANHGQTVRHEPNATPPFSIQLGDGQAIADQTNIKTLSQFRQADMAVGGQGAPLMPAFHQAIFGNEKFDQQENSYVLNLGGIANISHLGETVIGFDTGPANTLLDQWIQRHLNQSFDENGRWAATGEIIKEVLDALLSDPYFSADYPKSTGPDYFNLDWLSARVESLSEYAPADIQASLLALTATTVSLGVKQINLKLADNTENKIYVCGGGAKNPILMRALRDELPNYNIRITDELGIPSNWVESVGFAWLGYCRLHGIPSNLPSVTGAKKSVVLGEIYHPR